MLIIEMKVDNCILNNAYCLFIFALVDPQGPTEDERIAHESHQLAGKDCARACYVVESVRNALTLRGARWVNQCKNGFNKRWLKWYYLLPLQLSAGFVKIPAP